MNTADYTKQQQLKEQLTMKLSKFFTIIALSATVTSSLPIPMVKAESTTANETKIENQLPKTDLKETPKEKQRITT